MENKTSFTGALKRAAKTSVNLLPQSVAIANPDFFVIVNPRSWAFEDGEWLPELGMQMIIPGVRNITTVRQNGRTYIDDTLCRINLTRKGWIIISDEEPRLEDIIEGGLCIKAWQCQGGKAYRYAWETPVMGFNGIVWKTDLKMKNDFRRAVRDRLMPVVNILFLAHFVKQKEKRVGRLMDLSKTRPSVIDQMRIEKSQLAAMKASLTKSEPSKKAGSTLK